MDSCCPTTGRWIVALTGASGIRYGVKLIQLLADNAEEVHVVFSDAALRVLHEEDQRSLSFRNLSPATLWSGSQKNVTFYNPRDIGATIASGSALFDGMVICPCSMNTLAAVAGGMASNLIHRAADVTIKESRRLVIVPRETPLSKIHLKNMLELSEMGVRIVPAMPGFYHQPTSIDDLVDMLVMKILDQLGVPNNIVNRWSSAGHSVSGKEGSNGVVLELRSDG